MESKLDGQLSQFMQEMLQRRLVLFGGKGGVGKSVCACATATQLAKNGKKSLVYSVDPAHSLSDCFGHQIGNRITSVAPNLYALEVDASQLFDDLKKRYSEAVADAFGRLSREVDLPFERQILAGIMDLSPPGLDELMGLSKLADIVGSSEYDSIMVDLAAGAHSVRLIKVPRLFEDWLEKTFSLLSRYRSFSQANQILSLIETLKKNVSVVRELFADKSETMLVTVTTPEMLPITVAEDIVEAARTIGMQTMYMIINQIVPKNCDCSFCKAVEKEQVTCFGKVEKRFPNLYIIRSPLFPRQIAGLEMLSALGEILSSSDSRRMPNLEKRPSSFAMTTLPQLVFSDDFRVMMFGGKGGCGKTTCSAATGVLAAKMGKKVLVFSIDPQRSLSDVFCQDLGEDIVNVNSQGNLYALQIHPEKLLDDFKLKNREEILDIVTDATYIKREEASDFLDLSLPGMDEVVALLKLAEILESEKFDLLILDTAPTGHTLRFLEMPRLLSSWTKLLFQMRYKTRYIAQTLVGRIVKTRPDIFLENIQRDIRKVRAVLTARDTAFFVVTTAEEMALAETTGLLRFLRTHEMNVAGIAINKIVNSREDCDFCTSRSSLQQRKLGNWIKELSGIPSAWVSAMPHEVRGLEELWSFAQQLYTQSLGEPAKAVKVPGPKANHKL